jgi:triacylglycerol lipase
MFALPAADRRRGGWRAFVEPQLAKNWLFASRLVCVLVLGLLGSTAMACKDAVLMVHGNTAYPSSWDNTYNKLLANGWSSGEIMRPSWGSKSCAACNDHYGWELDTIKNAVNSAIAKSCTGKIDVLGHSMGVTLSARALTVMGKTGRVNSFIGIAGAIRGLNSCGTYPYNVASTTCGAWDLSKKSKLVESIRGKRYGGKIYSIKSYYDQVVCYGGCYVEGTHTSNIYYQNATYTYNNLGHFNLQKYTSSKQYELINR